MCSVGSEVRSVLINRFNETLGRRTQGIGGPETRSWLVAVATSPLHSVRAIHRVNALLSSHSGTHDAFPADFS